MAGFLFYKIKAYYFGGLIDFLPIFVLSFEISIKKPTYKLCTPPTVMQICSRSVTTFFLPVPKTVPPSSL